MKYLIGLLFATQFLYAAEPEYRVAIFGTNYSFEESVASLADPKLEMLFRSIKSQKPNAVFFTGDLIMGLENSEKMNPEVFKKQLEYFSNVKNKFLGKEIPFYPTLGNHRQVSYDIVETFREHFNIQNISPRPPYHLAYTVSIDDAEFIVLATGYDEPPDIILPSQKSVNPILDWLEKYLDQNPGSYKYRYVLSHFPAFSSTGSAGYYLGLDKDLTTRDIFWKILRDNHINAYFCSYEPLYDRSNREGIWQVISGGIVSEITAKHGEKKFSNYLLLIWGGNNPFPILKVFDLEGREWDTFRVIPLNFPVHQMRISDKNQGSIQ